MPTNKKGRRNSMTLFVDTPRERFTPGGRFTFHGLRPEGGLRFAVYISWFTAAPVYASQFTFHGLRLRQFTLRGLHYMVNGCASLRFAVYISWFTAAPVDASLLTPCGLFTLCSLTIY